MIKHSMTYAVALTVCAGPAMAAKGPFLSLANTDFVVLVSFILFIAVLIYFKVPGMLTKILDDRSAGIQSELDDARALREEAQTLLASYERRQKEVQDQSDRIVAQAKADAEAAAAQARDDLAKSIERRVSTAEDQIASAQASAIKDVRDMAAGIAIQAAREVIAKQMTAAEGNKLIDAAIAEVDIKLH